MQAAHTGADLLSVLTAGYTATDVLVGGSQGHIVAGLTPPCFNPTTRRQHDVLQQASRFFQRIGVTLLVRRSCRQAKALLPASPMVEGNYGVTRCPCLLVGICNLMVLCCLRAVGVVLGLRALGVLV